MQVWKEFAITVVNDKKVGDKIVEDDAADEPINIIITNKMEQAMKTLKPRR